MDRTALLVRSGDCFQTRQGNTWLVESAADGIARCVRVRVTASGVAYHAYDFAGTPHDIRAIYPHILDESPLYLLGYGAWFRCEPCPYPAGTLAASEWAKGADAAEADAVAHAEAAVEGDRA